MKIDWFPLGFIFLGLINVLSGCYEWAWWWRIARQGYFVDLIGWNRTRILYIVNGGLCLGLGIGLGLEGAFSAKSIGFYAVGFALTVALTVVLYNARGNQSIVELFRGKAKPEKRKNEDEADSG